MGRIVEAQRIPTVDAFHGHWGEAEVVNGGPLSVELSTGVMVTRAQFLVRRNDYHTRQGELIDIDETQIPEQISQRTTTWGTGPNDEAGVWFHLGLYKGVVKLKLGTRHPLYRIVPNLGEMTPGVYANICHRFESHWSRVLLVKPGMMVADWLLANLQAAHASIEANNLAVMTLDEATRPQTRSEMEHDYGDVIETEREEDSIVAIMLAYDTTIRSKFPGQPIVESLPRVFPGEGGPTLPTFRYNVIQQPGAVVKVFYDPPDPALANAALLFLKEGVVELTQPVTSTTPDAIQTHNFSGVTLVGELDELELRDGDGATIARGVRDTSLPEPVGPT